LQEVSLETTKLLTKAYYQLLKEERITVNPEAVRPVASSSSQGPRLSWDILKQADIPQVLGFIQRILR
jgi:hypothetical protein